MRAPLCPLPVGDLRRVDDDGAHEAWGVDQEVALAPGGLLAAVEATQPAHERLDRLDVR
jgi:hypothetical protein